MCCWTGVPIFGHLMWKAISLEKDLEAVQDWGQKEVTEDEMVGWHHWLDGLHHARLPCSSLSPRVCSDSRPLSQWCHPTTSFFVICFSSCLQSFPASGQSFPASGQFSSSGQSIGVSASATVLPMNIQDWFLLGWTGWISLQSNGLSRVFSNTTVQKHQFFSAQLSLWSNSHIQRDYWKNHSFDYMNLCSQSNVSAF